ncbi:ankyrin repeat protein [Colletotrichum truncatum]|uniref:Ankyrin repeat protein n=1 Tax=Colletotrichum truncatum TaxID=5467 RepID=A0ACC3ZFK6_COLTU|nr:ankyrin repeat protein [Colletotrichum truncatum]KAF6801790.1 ankyrin repeat protein [Colletotrichum truncatum]
MENSSIQADATQSRTGAKKGHFSKLKEKLSLGRQKVSFESVHLKPPTESSRPTSRASSIGCSSISPGNVSAETGDEGSHAPEPSTRPLSQTETTIEENGAHSKPIMRQHAVKIWGSALEAVTKDPKMKEFILEYEDQLIKLVEQDNKSIPTFTTSLKSESLEDCLKTIGITLQDAGKHQQAKDTTLGILTVVKGLSSFVGSLLSESPPAAMAWAGICACLPIIATPIEQDKKMISGLEYIYGRAPIYFDLPDELLQHDGSSTGISKGIKNAIQPLYEGTLKFVMMSVCSIHRRRLRRFWDAISDQARWENLLDEIKEAEKNLQLDTPIYQQSRLLYVAEEIRMSLQKNHDQKEAKERKKFLDSLGETNYQVRLGTTKRRLDGTCQWFRQHPRFKKWLNSKDGLLLVSADAGCGKSVLAKYLIEEVLYEEDPKATICYFFFKDDDPQARSFTSASKSLLHCLLSSKECLLDGCKKEFPNSPSDISGFRQVWSAFSSASREPSAGSVICVLDALDESDPEQRKDFLSHIRMYLNKDESVRGAKFIITTRGYPQIINEFTKFPSRKIHLDGDNDEEKTQIQKEISIVMDYRLQELKEKVPDISESTLDIIREGLSRNGKEQRTYLWMHLMFELVEKRRWGNRAKWRALFQNPPDTVAKAYGKLLESVQPESRREVRTLLALILAAERPLTLKELSIAVCARTNTEESQKFDFDDVLEEGEFKNWIRWECGSFVAIHGSKAYLIHQTAREFLMEGNNTNQDYWQGSITEREAHRYMAESCISLLSSEQFEDPVFNDNAYEFYVLQRPSVQIDEEFECPFLEYSVVYWLDHFHRCQEQLSSDAMDISDISGAFNTRYQKLFRQNHSHCISEASRFINEQERKTSHLGWCYLMMSALPPQRFPDGYTTRLRISGYTDYATPIACLFGHKRLLMYSLEKPGDNKAEQGSASSCRGTAEDDGRQFSLVHLAAFGGSEWCLRYLHSRGHDVTCENPDGLTPLHLAAGNGLKQTMQTLLGLGASENALDAGQRSPFVLAMATRDGRSYMKKYISSVKDQENKMRVLLYNAVVAEAPEKLAVQTLSQRTSNQNSTHRYIQAQIDSTEPESYFVAFRFTFPGRLIQALAHFEVDFEFRYEGGLTALQISVLKPARLANTFWLLRMGADMCAADSHGNTPLHNAVKAANYKALELLLWYGAEVDAKGENGDTPLNMASRVGNLVAASVLLKYGADPEIKNNEGLSPLDLNPQLKPKVRSASPIL